MIRRVLLILTLFAFAWRLGGVSRQSLGRDEVDAIYFALRDLPETLSMFVRAGQNGALFFLGLRPWLRLVGSSEFALRYPSAVFSVLAVPLLWQVGRRLMPSAVKPAPTGGLPCAKPRSGWTRFRALWREIMDDTALLAVIFLVINPYHLWYGQDGKMYSLVTLLALIAVWFWLQGIDRGGWRPWLGFLVTVSVAIYIHLLMILLVPLFLVWFLIAWPQSKPHWRGFLISLAGLTLPYLPLIWWQWELLAAGTQLTVMSFTPLPRLLGSTLLYQTYGILPPGEPLWRAPIIALGIAGLFLGFRVIAPHTNVSLPKLEGWRRYLSIISWLLVPLLAIYLSSLRQPVFLPRYVIWIAPAVMMILALGVQLVRLHGGRFARPLATALLVYVIVFWGYLGWQEKTRDIKYDLRNAVKYIYEQRRPDDLLILQIPHTELAYRYYSSDRGTAPFEGSEERLGRWVGGLSTNNDLDDDEARGIVGEQMRTITGTSENIWVLYSERELSDPRHLMDDWLTHNLELVHSEDFHGAQVQFFRNRAPD